MTSIKTLALSLLLGVVLSACVTDGIVAPEARQYVVAFAEEYDIVSHSAVYITEDRAEFIELSRGNADRLALCIYLKNEVIIDGSKWQIMNDLSRKAVVWHELGHCDMNRGHVDMDAHMMAADLMINTKQLEEDWPLMVESLHEDVF